MKIIIYSTATCHYCKEVKNYFNKKDISFEVMDVGADKVARKEMVEKSGQMGVPVTEIDGEIIVGYQPDLFDKLINTNEKR